MRTRIGKYTYYYLEHSTRDNGKVRKREIYLGKKLPQNIEQIRAKLIADILAEKWHHLLANELVMLKEKLTESARVAFSIFHNPRTDFKVRLKAIRLLMDVSIALMQVSFDGPLMIHSNQFKTGRIKL